MALRDFSNKLSAAIIYLCLLYEDPETWVIFMHWVFLTLAVVGETLGTSAMKVFVSDGYLVTGIILAMVTIGISYTLLSKATVYLSIAFANAAWECIGMVIIAAISFLFLKENISLIQFTGMILSIIGIVVIHFGYKKSKASK